MPVDLFKTMTYLVLHLTIAFGVAYLLTGSVAIAGAITLVEPLANAVAFYFHEKVWKGALKRPRWMKATGAPADKLVLRKS
jgi:uncharacterized membrane protein